MKEELLAYLQALDQEMKDLLFVPGCIDERNQADIAYMNGCDDTKRDALQLVEKKIKEVKSLS